MSEDNKDKDFDFIKEHIIENKKKKYKKWIVALLMTISMAIVFGIIASLTICIAEPRFYKRLHKEEDNKTPVCFPTDEQEVTVDPIEGQTDPKGDDDQSEGQEKASVEEDDVVVEPVIVEHAIDADIEDFSKMYNDIKAVAYKTNRALVKVTSIFEDTDWFNIPVETAVVSSGLVIANNTEDLLILVSLDRIVDASAIRIDFTKDISVEAVVQDFDIDINLAVLAVSLADIPEIFLKNIVVATLGESYSVSIGNPVVALGNPNGYTGSMEIGLITSKGSSVCITDNQLDLFNTNMYDNKNGDGVIVNLEGQVVGLITRTLKEDLNENISTIIGISKLKQIIAQMSNQTPRVYFGIKAGDMTEAVLLSNNVPNGIYVNEVETNSPAYAAGIKSGDIITQVNDQIITATYNFYTAISKHEPRDQITVKLKRTTASGKEMNLIVTLAKKVK